MQKEAQEYVAARARSEWASAHPRNPLSRLLRRILGIRPIQVVWIEQYESGDWDKARCTGRVVQSWRCDAGGLTAVDKIGEVDGSAAVASTTPVIRFCVDGKGERMIYTEWHGARAGHGTVMVHEENKGWKTAPPSWRS